MNDDDDEAEEVAVLSCGECGSAAFNFTLSGQILCDECGGLLGSFNTRGAPLGVEVH